MPRGRKRPIQPDTGIIASVTAAPKAVSASVRQVAAQLEAKGQATLPVELSPNASRPDIQVELNVYARSPIPTSWRASVKINRMRVDGLDYHVHELRDPAGRLIKGWHRDRYDAASGGTLRIPIADPASDGRIVTFLKNALAALNVSAIEEGPDEQRDLDFT